MGLNGLRKAISSNQLIELGHLLVSTREHRVKVQDVQVGEGSALGTWWLRVDLLNELLTSV
jgi:hypothetical protein